eukprot:gene10628-biopygen7590
MAPFDALKTANDITQEQYNSIKLDVVKEEAAKISMNAKTTLQQTHEQFSSEEIKRQPWLKELLNQRDLWRRHTAAVSADEKAWEEDVVATFLAKASGGQLSPLLTIIGQYLLFSADKEVGRRYLLEILFKQPASIRLKVHNWAVLETAPVGTALVMGPKVEHLPVPLFPWQDAKLKELNAKILDLADTCEGGSLAEDDELRKLFAPEDKVLPGSLLSGGGIKHVLDPQGNQTGYVIDTTDIEEAFNGLKEALQCGDVNLLARFQEMERSFSEALER